MAYRTLEGAIVALLFLYAAAVIHPARSICAESDTASRRKLFQEVAGWLELLEGLARIFARVERSILLARLEYIELIL